VNAAVSGGDLVSPTTQTSCVLDPASAPGGFGAFASGCAFAGAGQPVSVNGVHRLYAASANGAGYQGPVASATFRIDRTPPSLRCVSRPTFALGSSGGFIAATVHDSVSGPASSMVFADANTSSPGNRAISLRGFDNAGNSATIRCAYVVRPPLLSPSPTMTWNFNPFSSYTIVERLVVGDVPGLASVRVSCSGRGCPFKVHAARAEAAACGGKGCGRAHPARTVNLTRLFAGRHLGVGASLTVAIVQRNRIGKVFIFKMRSGQQPSSQITCLVPGSSRPGRGC
jgi:hypothetical protein